MKLDCTVMVLHGVLDDGKAEARAAGRLIQNEIRELGD